MSLKTVVITAITLNEGFPLFLSCMNLSFRDFHTSYVIPLIPGAFPLVDSFSASWVLEVDSFSARFVWLDSVVREVIMSSAALMACSLSILSGSFSSFWSFLW